MPETNRNKTFRPSRGLHRLFYTLKRFFATPQEKTDARNPHIYGRQSCCHKQMTEEKLSDRNTATADTTGFFSFRKPAFP